MKCFRKTRESAQSLYSGEIPHANVDLQHRQNTYNQSSEVVPASRETFNETPLQKTAESSREINDPKTKLCQFCGEAEGVPASLVTAIDSPQCPHHRDRTLDLYCPSHCRPVCAVCASTTHLPCPEIQNLDEVCQEKSEELWNFVGVLRDHEKNVAELRRKVMARLKSKGTGQVSDEDVQSSEKGTEWQGGDQKTVKCPHHSGQGHAGQDNCEVCRLLACHSKDCAIIQHLLEAEAKKSGKGTQFSGAENPSTSQEGGRGNPPSLWITVTSSPGSSYKLHTSTDPSPPPTTVPAQKRRRKNEKPRGADLAKVLEIGHRVKRSRDYEGRNLGTIIAIPAVRTAAHDGDTTGLVDVRWDAGGEGTYRMGRFNHFELELA